MGTATALTRARRFSEKRKRVKKMMSEDQRFTEACERHLIFPSTDTNSDNAAKGTPSPYRDSAGESASTWKLDRVQPANILSMAPQIRECSPSREAIDLAARRVLDQMMMDQFVLCLADELGWNDASSLLLQQQRRARFRLVDQSTSTENATVSTSAFEPSNAEPTSDDERNTGGPSCIPPGETGGENSVVAEKKNRDGGRCSCGPDHVVRPPVADHLVEVRGPIRLRTNSTSAMMITSSAH